MGHMTLVPATQDIMQRLEEMVDRVHDDHPLMRTDSSVAVMKIIFAAENSWRTALPHLRSNPAAIDALELFTRVTLALDQCLNWISARKAGPISSDCRSPTDARLDDFLQLAFGYACLCQLFTAWHRGLATEVLVDQERRFVYATLPRRLSIYHGVAMQFHHAPTSSDADNALKLSRSAILSDFAGDLGKVPMHLWQPAFDALYRVVEFDWDVDWAGDLGGFTMLDARRAAVTLRLWGELMIFSSSGISVAQEKDLAGLLARYSNLQPHVATALVRDMAFDISNPRGDAASYPLTRLREDTFVTWSPIKAFITNHHRELLRRLSVRDRTTHDRLSDAKHEALIQQLRVLVASHEPRLSFVSKVMLKDTDIDALIIDNNAGTYFCLEVKAPLSPRTLREALDTDARRTRSGTLTDGLLKGSSVQIPKILKHASEDPAYFLSRIKVFAGEVALPAPRRVLGAVLSAWTFGTGEADDIESQALPYQRTVRVITLPLLRQALIQSSGDLNLLYDMISCNEYLATTKMHNQRVTYGDWTFEWLYA